MFAMNNVGIGSTSNSSANVVVARNVIRKENGNISLIILKIVGVVLIVFIGILVMKGFEELE